MKRIITILILLICNSTFGQDSVKTYNTFKSKQFEVNDIILAPKIYFQLSGGQRVISEHYDSVKVIADFLLANPTIVIELGVHSDIRGPEASNLKLSERKALNLKAVLEHHFNIQPERLIATGYGESYPIITEKEVMAAPTEEKENLHAINRRVEIRILKL